ncbi:MAG: helix-turn-helix transcriptional regulator [Oscillospiraceae bacterium]|nr:helix-turn-helix transcriptional regulator [Oscillospiraceae bacterium]
MFETFRQNVKSSLKERGLTYAQLGEKSNLAESTIKYFMCGASNSRRVAEKIADCLGWTLRYENGQYLPEIKEDL